MDRRLTAIIPAAGEATRLRPHTLTVQKPMLPMGDGDKRLIDWALGISKSANRTFTILHYDKNRTSDLEERIRSRSESQLLRDKRRMGAASLIAFADDLFMSNYRGDSIILPADHVIDNLDVDDFYSTHKETDAECTVLTVPTKQYGQYISSSGDIAMGIHSIRELGDKSSSGIYIIKNEQILQWTKDEKSNGWNGDARSLLRDFIIPMIQGNKVATYALPDDGYWDDAGTIQRYYYNKHALK